MIEFINIGYIPTTSKIEQAYLKFLITNTGDRIETSRLINKIYLLNKGKDYREIEFREDYVFYCGFLICRMNELDELDFIKF